MCYRAIMERRVRGGYCTLQQLLGAKARLNPILPITLQHLSYLSRVIGICILQYPIQAFPDRTRIV
jgi:hypothetical protein